MVREELSKILILWKQCCLDPAGIVNTFGNFKILHADLFKSRLQFNISKLKDLFLCFSPEREDPGNKSYDTINIPKLIGGSDEKSLEIGMGLMAWISVCELG